jgi:hypothetical protein
MTRERRKLKLIFVFSICQDIISPDFLDVKWLCKLRYIMFMMNLGNKKSCIILVRNSLGQQEIKALMRV